MEELCIFMDRSSNAVKVAPNETMKQEMEKMKNWFAELQAKNSLCDTLEDLELKNLNLKNNILHEQLIEFNGLQRKSSDNVEKPQNKTVKQEMDSLKDWCRRQLQAKTSNSEGKPQRQILEVKDNRLQELQRKSSDDVEKPQNETAKPEMDNLKGFCRQQLQAKTSNGEGEPQLEMLKLEINWVKDQVLQQQKEPEARDYKKKYEDERLKVEEQLQAEMHTRMAQKANSKRELDNEKWAAVHQKRTERRRAKRQPRLKDLDAQREAVKTEILNELHIRQERGRRLPTTRVTTKPDLRSNFEEWRTMSETVLPEPEGSILRKWARWQQSTVQDLITWLKSPKFKKHPNLFKTRRNSYYWSSRVRISHALEDMLDIPIKCSKPDFQPLVIPSISDQASQDYSPLPSLRPLPKSPRTVRKSNITTAPVDVSQDYCSLPRQRPLPKPRKSVCQSKITSAPVDVSQDYRSLPSLRPLPKSPNTVRKSAITSAPVDVSQDYRSLPRQRPLPKPRKSVRQSKITSAPVDVSQDYRSLPSLRPLPKSPNTVRKSAITSAPVDMSQDCPLLTSERPLPRARKLVRKSKTRKSSFTPMIDSSSSEEEDRPRRPISSNSEASPAQDTQAPSGFRKKWSSNSQQATVSAVGGTSAAGRMLGSDEEDDSELKEPRPAPPHSPDQCGSVNKRNSGGANEISDVATNCEKQVEKPPAGGARISPETKDEDQSGLNEEHEGKNENLDRHEKVVSIVKRVMDDWNRSRSFTHESSTTSKSDQCGSSQRLETTSPSHSTVTPGEPTLLLSAQDGSSLPSEHPLPKPHKLAPKTDFTTCPGTITRTTETPQSSSRPTTDSPSSEEEDRPRRPISEASPAQDTQAPVSKKRSSNSQQATVSAVGGTSAAGRMLGSDEEDDSELKEPRPAPLHSPDQCGSVNKRNSGGE